MNKRIGAGICGLSLVLALGACGGETESAAPPMTVATKPPPVATTPPPEPTSTATTEAMTPPKPTMEEMQKKRMMDFNAALNAHDAKAMAAGFAVDGVTASLGPTGWMETKGREEIEKHYAEDFVGYPDAKLTFVRVFPKGKTVVSQWVWTATNKGEVMGEKPSDKPVGINGATITWFNDDGLVTKEHIYYDVGTILAQEGRIKNKVRPIPTGMPDKPDVIKVADDKNVAVLNANYDAFNKHDPKAFGATITDDSVHVDYTSAEDVKGKAANEKEMEGYFKAFPDIKETTDNTWGFGDWVLVESTVSGTMKGALGPLKPTKKFASAVHLLEIDQMKDGKIAKTETYWSSMEFMGQFDLLPKPKPEKTTAKPPAPPPAKK